MATVRDFYTGDGTTVLFPISFEYLDQSHVLATVNNVPTTDFVFVNESTIQFGTAPANGALIAIFRQTPVDESEAVFFAGSPIRAADLNQNNTQLLYVAQETSQVSNDSFSQSGTAISIANGAVVTANAADAKADQAIIDSAAAVVTANTAESNSLAAVSTANAAAVTAGNAVSTANSAVSTANGAVSTANAAVVTANAADANATQASIDAAAAVVTANAADANASAAVITANAADANASAAVITANAADANASAAVSTANAAVVTANAAEATALIASADAANAIAAVSAAALYVIIADVAAIPGSPSNGDGVQITDSTGIELFTPLSGLPLGFVGDPGLFIRLRYDSGTSSWVFVEYQANDPEARYGSAITAAQGDATQALSDAAAAQGDATQALSDAAAAQGDATQALFDAAAAQGDATQALSDAAAAQGDATQALSDAAAAQSTANAALPQAGGTLTGDVTLANQADLRFGEATSNGTNYVGFQAPSAITADVLWTLPATDAAVSGYALKSDGSGNLSWGLAGGALGGGTDQVFYENDQVVTTNYTLGTNKNAVTAGPITINSGITVTVPAGQSWVIV